LLVLIPVYLAETHDVFVLHVIIGACFPIFSCSDRLQDRLIVDSAVLLFMAELEEEETYIL
jgi:hypothetical protein